MKEGNNFAYLDAQNIYQGIKELGWSIDWRKFRIYLNEKYDVKKAYLFFGYIPDKQNLYLFLRRVGFILQFKPIIKHPDGKVKGNVDADMVLRAALDLPRYDQAIIVTGDGDFYSLVQHLYKADKLGAVLCPNIIKCSFLLRKEAREKIMSMDTLQYKIGQ